MNNFNLDPRLENSSVFITDLDLCQVRLHKNMAFPWVLLIPQKPNIKELTDLTKDEQNTLMAEVSKVTKVIQDLYWPDKMNVATLGNVVSQLHVHVIARFTNDPAWPHPIWGRDIEKPGLKEDLDEAVAKIKPLLLG